MKNGEIEEKVNLKNLQIRLFIDSAVVEEIREATETGIIAGVAMNPGKVSQIGRPVEDIVRETREFFDGPISIQGIGKTAEEIVPEAERLSKISRNLAIKVPVNKEGIKAVRILIPMGVKTNATLVFSPAQGLAAGLANSTLISPFVGRSTDIGYDGIEVIRQIRSMYDRYGISTQIIAASIKNAKQVIDSVIAGADMVAVPLKVLNDMLYHPLTEKGIEQFVSGWEKAFGS